MPGFFLIEGAVQFFGKVMGALAVGAPGEFTGNILPRSGGRGDEIVGHGTERIRNSCLRPVRECTELLVAVVRCGYDAIDCGRVCCCKFFAAHSEWMAFP